MTGMSWTKMIILFENNGHLKIQNFLSQLSFSAILRNIMKTQNSKQTQTILDTLWSIPEWCNECG
jgi:hypothetical protein